MLRRSLPTVLSDVENPLAVVPASAPLLAAAPEPQRCRRGREVINNPGRGAETAGRFVLSCRRPPLLSGDLEAMEAVCDPNRQPKLPHGIYFLAGRVGGPGEY
ncbi:hypothetical protein QQF64_020971 [Cirrhinus molitorella]|uniref:Uncharacterized protein n=1 Tax=Cirrhinus molitorella TaxID=172907 RepID=A0ABR3LAN4_9TELE